MFSNNIKQRLKILEILSNKDSKSAINPIIYFDTEPNQEIYKISDADLKYCKNIKDADKLTFTNEQECQEWIDNNIELIDLPSFYESKRSKLKAFLINIVDNSYLEQFMYDNKGG